MLCHYLSFDAYSCSLLYLWYSFVKVSFLITSLSCEILQQILLRFKYYGYMLKNV